MRDEPDRCRCCLEFLATDREKRSLIHVRCLGTGPADARWVICASCGVAFLCDNGVLDDCPVCDVPEDGDEYGEACCASCSRPVGLYSRKAVERSGDMIFCSYECRMAELAFEKADAKGGFCGNPNLADCHGGIRYCEACGHFLKETTEDGACSCGPNECCGKLPF